MIPPIVNPVDKRVYDNFMPLGLLSLAANIQTTGNEVRIYQPKICLIQESDFAKAAMDIMKHKPGLIGFSTWCITYPASLLIAKEIKKMAPEIPIIFGGPQATILARKTLQDFAFIDFVFSGEADFSFPKFIKELGNPVPNLSIIPGLSFRNASGMIQHNNHNGSITNLDELPVPAYNLVPGLNWLKLDVGRGCPFQCTYCSTNEFFSKKYRVKSAGRIIEEMMQAFQKKKITSFSFSHDMFTLNKKFVFELCNKLISIGKKKGIKFKWNCSARIDCVSEEMLIKMKDAGCSDIFFGIESGSDRMQQIIKKNLKVSAVLKIADICRLVGIRMHASFIIGFPEETGKDLNDTLQLALSLSLKGTLTQVSELTLLPGTPIYNDHYKKLKFDGHFSNFSRNFCGKEETQLIKKYPEMFSSFFYLPIKLLSRQQLIFLRLLINKSKDFRNTLFLLSAVIKKDIERIDLLTLYKNEFKKINIEDEDTRAIVKNWIKAIDNYIIKNNAKIRDDYIRDIFVYESYSALLLALYSTWALVHPKTDKYKFKDQFIIQPTPIWKVISVNHKLESVLPSENGWEENTKRIRKGGYIYLLIAVSPAKCRRIKINKTDKYLLESLSHCSFEDFISKIEAEDYKKEIFSWLKKMQRLGVIETRPVKEKIKSQPRFADKIEVER